MFNQKGKMIAFKPGVPVETPRWPARIVVTSLLLMVLTAATPGTQAALPTELSLAGPQYANTDGSFDYEGRLTLDGSGIPLQEVEVFVDEVVVAAGTTNLDGYFEVSVTFPSKGIVEVIAVAFPETPLEAPSEPLEVIVGPVDLSVTGPSRTNHGLPTAYEGQLSVAGTPIPARTVDVFVDGGLVASGTTDAAGDYAISFTFPAKGLVDVAAIALPGTILEVLTEPLEVIVGPVDVSLTGPLTADRDMPTDYSGQLSVAGTPLPSLTVDVFVDDVLVASATTDAAGEFAVPLEFQTRAYHEVVALALKGTPAEGQSAPLTVAVETFTQISAGSGHTCGLVADGTARCWGANAVGQLGDGTTTARLTPVVVNGLTDAVAISAGSTHTCAVLSDGTARCWGHNAWGQLGDGTTSIHLTPVEVRDLTDAVAVTLGPSHSCALIADGSARCWGSNGAGRLGDGTQTHRRTPVSVSGLTDAVAISAGSIHTCAVLADGTARCWGLNRDGQLGDGTETNRLSPVEVTNLTGAAAVTAGDAHTCAALTDGSARCWGSNRDGRLGDGTEATRLAPVEVRNLTNAVSITTGQGHTCALLVDGASRCWGDNQWGQVGDNTTSTHLTPMAVHGLTGVGLVKAGSYHTCAVLNDGNAHCWGRNSNGQLGDGTTTARLTPVEVL